MTSRKTVRKWSSVAVLAALALCGASAARAGTTGRLSGQVLDAKKQPLAGVNVAIPDARLGAITDAEGRYAIFNVPAGTYTVRVSLMGYAATTLTGVAIPADRTTTQDVTLQENAVQLQEVVVSARRPVVELGLTSNVATVTRGEIAQLPVQKLEDLVNLQAGVVDGHIRGGRQGEVQYQVDGLTVNNPFDNRSSVQLDRSVLEEVQVISGTFDAEYGNAMSGVVNAVLRRGSDRFEWSGEALAGDYLYSGTRRPEPDELRPNTIKNYQLTVSGPTGLPNTIFLASGRYGGRNGYMEGLGRLVDVDYRRPEPFLLSPGEAVPVGYTKEWLGVAKLTNRSLPGIEIGYQGILNRIESRDENWDWRLDVDGLPKKRTFSAVHGVEWTHTLRPTTFYRLNVRQNYFDYKEMVFDDVNDSLYDRRGAARSGNQMGIAPPGFLFDAILGGVSPTRIIRSTNAMVFAGSVNHVVGKDHQLKGGFEWQPARLHFGTPGYLVWSGNAWIRHGNEPAEGFLAPQTYHPVMGSIYAQDDIEWNDLRFRAGLRYEYFNAKTTVPGDLANPANSIPGATPVDARWASRKLRISPRLGVSYPVTTKTSLFFSYGHFYQMPQLGQIFGNADYSVLTNLQAVSDRDFGVLGNPDVKPEKTVQYQFGWKQQLQDWLGLDVTLFYKDISDLLGTEIQTTYNNADYERLANLDFGSVIGATVALDQRALGLVSTALDYTWQVANGNSSDPYEAASRRDAHEDLRPKAIPLNWDQRHTANLTVTLARPASFNVGGVFRVASGQPYKPSSDVGTTERNSARKPTSFLMDLRGEKTLGRLGATWSLFGVVYNVFDTRFFNGSVFTETGSPFYPRLNGYDEQKALANPTRYYPPRRVELGIRWEGGTR
ncbi:MAG TPA: TonB-dependent receptor [Candidatus Eisenbacteria bacterium]|nr:TonB-dependent receptor [Candidatus Eisenbacteria bacterium]